MDSAKYVALLQEALLSSAGKYFGGGKWFLQHDKASYHTSKRTTRKLLHLSQLHNFTVLPWPAHSPDMSPVENFNSVMKTAVASTEEPAKNLEELRHRINDTMDQLTDPATQIIFERYYSSLPRRLDAVIHAGGGPTKY